MNQHDEAKSLHAQSSSVQRFDRHGNPISSEEFQRRREQSLQAKIKALVKRNKRLLKKYDRARKAVIMESPHKFDRMAGIRTIDKKFLRKSW